MAQTIEIRVAVDALTDTATQKMAQFFQMVQSGLQSSTIKVPTALNKVPKTAVDASEGMKKLRETSMAAREAFHGLEATAELLGGSRFPMLAHGVMSARMGLMTLRSTAQLAGLSLETIAPVLGGLGLAVGTGILLWKDWNTETAKAEENARKMEVALKELPRAIGNVRALVSTKLVSASQGTSWLEQIGAFPAPAQPGRTPYAQELLKYAQGNPQYLQWMGNQIANQAVPRPDNLKALQEQLAKEGYLLKTGDEKNPQYELNPQIEALQRLQEMQKKVTEEGVSGFNKERLEALNLYKDLIAEAEKYGALAGKFFTSDQLSELKESIRQNYNWTEAGIDFKQSQEQRKQAEEAFSKRQRELAQQAKEARDKLERELTLTELQEGQKRGQNYEHAFAQRMRLAQEQYYAGEIEEKDYTAAVQEATIKRMEARQREAEQAIQLSQIERQNAEKKLQLQQQLISANPYVSELDKAKQLLPLLQQEYDLIKRVKLPGIEAQLQGSGLSEIDRARLTGQKLDLQGQAGGLETRIGELRDQSSFGGQFRRTMVGLQNEWGSWAQQAASAFRSVFESAIASISNGITGLIMGTKTWGQALMQIGTTILTTIIDAIIQMGVRWVLTQVMMALAGKAIAASATAASLPIAAAQAAIWATPATLATISSYGAAAAAAPGFIALAEGVTLAQSMAHFAEGGRPEPGRIALVGERGPELFIPDTQGSIITAEKTASLLQAAHSNAVQPARAVHSGLQKVDLALYMTDQRRAEDLKRDPGFEGIVLDVLNRNIWKYR